MTKCAVRKQVRSARKDLWTAQKEATMHRVAWLEENTLNISKAAGEVDWEKKTKNMAALAHDCGVNRKMTNAIKGYRRSLDRVEVPLYIWHYSNNTKKIYRYDKGVFKAHVAYTPQAILQPNHKKTTPQSQSFTCRYHPG